MPVPVRHHTQQAPRQWQRRAVSIKPSDRPLIIGVAIAGGVVLILALIWVYRFVRQKPSNPLPPARHLPTHYASAESAAYGKLTASPAAGSFSSLPSQPSLQWKAEMTTSNTPNAGLLQSLEAGYDIGTDQDRHPPRLPWVDSRSSSVSLATSNTSCNTGVGHDLHDRPNSSNAGSSNSIDISSSIPPSPSQERRRLREALPPSASPHPSFNSAISRHSLKSNVHSDSRHSPNILSPHGLPIRGAPHKTGIQIILPEPLAPAVIPRMVTQKSFSDHGHSSRQKLIKGGMGIGRHSRADTWTDVSRHTSSPGDVQLAPIPQFFMPTDDNTYSPPQNHSYSPLSSHPSGSSPSSPLPTPNTQTSPFVK